MQRKRKKPLNKKRKSFLQEYNFEIIVFSMITLGVFLLVEQMEISQTIFILMKKLIFLFADMIKIIRDKIYEIFDWIEISDLVGISIIFYVLYLVAERQRERLIKRFSNVRDCPECQGNLHRVKKSVKHKIMSYIYFVNVKNYRCKDCSKNMIKFVR